MNRAGQEQEVSSFLGEPKAVFIVPHFSVAAGLRNLRAWHLLKVAQWAPQGTSGLHSSRLSWQVLRGYASSPFCPAPAASLVSSGVPQK